MIISHFRRLSVRFFSKTRWFFNRWGSRLRQSPRWSAWFYDAPVVRSKSSLYRDYNHRCFADFHQQECMLADQPRMAFYHETIRRHVKPGDRVIDLGTGTGILAAFASRAGAAQVYAIDHSEILDHAEALAVANEISNVEFVAQHSAEFSLDERVDVIVHEQMGDFLFDEAMIPNVCDLRDRLLKPGGLILPSRFGFYCEPIQINASRRVPFIWELNVHGFGYRSLEPSRPEASDYYRLASCDLGVVNCFMSHPEAALEFDLHTVQEASLPKKLQFSRTVTTAGQVDGLAIFMKVQVDDDLVLSSSPKDTGRAPHWGFRILRLGHTEAKVGDTLDVMLEVEDWTYPDTWHWSCQKREAG
jgi:protein arginine N-methyltransferase 1